MPRSSQPQSDSTTAPPKLGPVRVFARGGEWLIDYGSYACAYYATRNEAIKEAKIAVRHERRDLLIETACVTYLHTSWQLQCAALRHRARSPLAGGSTPEEASNNGGARRSPTQQLAILQPALVWIRDWRSSRGTSLASRPGRL